MSQRNLEVVLSVYDAFDSRDLAAVLHHLDDDVEVVATEGLPWSGTYYGPDGFSEFIHAVEEHIRVTFDVHELYSSGESVAQIGRLVGLVNSTGELFNIRVIHAWNLRDGKVVSFRNYPDTDAQRRALGLPLDDGDADTSPGPGRGSFWG
jgi:ketosteroid isomerase-like protein